MIATLLRTTMLHPWASRAAALALAAALLATAWWDGSRSGAANERVHTAQAAAAAERAEQAAYARGMAAGAQLVAELQQQLQASADFTAELQRSPAHAAPILVQRTASAAACPPAAASAARPGAAAQPPQAAAGAASSAAPAVLAERADAGPADPGPELLTAGAVSVWDSALRGVPVASGACGTADAPEGACAAAAPGGLTVADAWANHTLNAQLCRDDRARHQALIDHLRNTQTGFTTP